jgi:hypothetical protein
MFILSIALGPDSESHDTRACHSNVALVLDKLMLSFGSELNWLKECLQNW